MPIMSREVRITKDGEPILRATAEAVPLTEITSPQVQRVIADMSAALATERFGVAIAAPQIGESMRIFVVAGSVFDRRSHSPQGLHVDQVFINPVILSASKKRQTSHESCLSIQGRPTGPDVAGIVARPEKMTISYYDEHGTQHQRGASGLLAAIFDHEIDHLNGTLFIDKADELWEIDQDFNRIS